MAGFATAGCATICSNNLLACTCLRRRFIKLQINEAMKSDVHLRGRAVHKLRCMSLAVGLYVVDTPSFHTNLFRALLGVF